MGAGNFNHDCATFCWDLPGWGAFDRSTSTLSSVTSFGIVEVHAALTVNGSLVQAKVLSSNSALRIQPYWTLQPPLQSIAVIIGSTWLSFRKFSLSIQKYDIVESNGWARAQVVTSIIPYEWFLDHKALKMKSKAGRCCIGIDDDDRLLDIVFNDFYFTSSLVFVSCWRFSFYW